MFIKIFAGLVAAVVVLVVVVAMQPDDFRVARSASITAPSEIVFAHVNDLHKWQQWSPWAKMDPNAKISFAGPSAGTGSAFTWAGNNQVGEGTMTITESKPGELVRFRLDFRKPFAGTNDAEFTFKPEGAQTVVTWNMSGKNNFISKAVGLVMNCDKMVGGQFEQGLASMRSLCESKTGSALAGSPQ